MDKASLIGPDIHAGKVLLAALERAGLAISIAAWLRLRGAIGWNLFIASPDVQKYGPLTVNKFIDKIRTAIESTVSMDEITATNTTNHFINRIPQLFFSSAIHLKHGGFHTIEALNIEDIDIEYGVVYKIDRDVRPSKEAPRPNAEALKKAKLAA
jgi:hypothetical protein